MVTDTQTPAADDGLLTVTFIMLCHDSAERVVNRARLILDDDPTCKLIIHFDKKSSRQAFNTICQQLESHPRCHIMRNRVRCGWGQWGLVEAPLRALHFALRSGEGGYFASDYFYLVSEYCYPAKPIKELREHLTAYAGTDFIECEDSSWIKGGIREDRYRYRHYLDKRKHPKLHRWMYRLQKKLGLKRKVPAGLEVRFGSQWWCLSENTIKSLLHMSIACSKFEFLKNAWIPDECYFQSLVYYSGKGVISLSPTYSSFNSSGCAEYQQQFDFAKIETNKFFVRKYE